MQLFPVNGKTRRRLDILRMNKRRRVILVAVAGGGRKWLPSALSTLRSIATERWDMVPESVKRLAFAIWKLEELTLPANPRRSSYRVALNKSFAALRLAYPYMFWEARNWLNSAVAAQLFDSRGAHWARVILYESLGKVSSGMVAHRAFNMTGGAVSTWGFSKTEDAALLAEHLHRNEGFGVSESKDEAAYRLGADRRGIDRITIPRLHDAKELKIQAACIVFKYKVGQEV